MEHQILIPCLCFWLLSVSCSSVKKKILFIPGHHLVSHTKAMIPVASDLMRRGHDVFVLEFSNLPRVKGLTVESKKWNISVITIPSISTKFDINANFWVRDTSHPWVIAAPWFTSVWACADLLANKGLRTEFFRLATSHWDLIVVDGLFAPCGVIFAKVNGGASAVFDTSKTCNSVHRTKGTMLSWSLYPYLRAAVSLGSRTAFKERLISWLGYALLELKTKLIYLVIPHCLPSSGSSLSGLSFETFYASSLFALSSMPYDLDFTVPRVHDVFRTQLHCAQPETLDAPYADFVNDANSKGTIILALGHYVSWNQAPERVFQSLFTVFSTLTDHRIVWQYDAKSLSQADIPKHVLISRWLPQKALLSHPKTVLFISHVGLKSISEAICFRVPVIALPLFAEQHVTTTLVVAKGLGLALDRHSMTAKDVDLAIKQILSNESYKKNMIHLHSLLTDTIRANNDEAVYRMEFFMRHRDKAHLLKQKGTQLNLVLLYSGDVLITLLLVVTLLCYFVR